MLEIGGVSRNFGGAHITLAITEERSCQYLKKGLGDSTPIWASISNGFPYA